MRINEVVYDDAQPVAGYGPGFFRIGGQVIEGAMLVSPSGAQPWDGAAETLVVLADQVDVIFLGTGAEIAHAASELRSAVEAAGMGLEVMASPAACRTYNVLLGEGRRVALAAWPV